MIEEELFEQKVEGLCQEDPRYKPEAYRFVMAALSYKLGKLGEVRHITGHELLEGTKELGLECFGPMTKDVFNHWGVQKCLDFGHVVFNLVDVGLLGKLDSDRIEDFEDGYDFEEEFVTKYCW